MPYQINRNYRKRPDKKIEHSEIVIFPNGGAWGNYRKLPETTGNYR